MTYVMKDMTVGRMKAEENALQFPLSERLAYLDALSGSKAKTLLEIGAGIGRLFEVWKKDPLAIPTVIAVEPNKRFHHRLSNISGVTLFKGTFEEYEGPFVDVICIPWATIHMFPFEEQITLIKKSLNLAKKVIVDTVSSDRITGKITVKEITPSGETIDCYFETPLFYERIAVEDGANVRHLKYVWEKVPRYGIHISVLHSLVIMEKTS